MDFYVRIVLLSLFSFAAVAEDPSAAIQHWLTTAAHPLADVSTQDVQDMRPMVHMIGQARVVGFGETAHQTHELQLLRLRALRALVKTGQVRVLAMEAGYVETLQLNQWLTGKSQVKPDFDAAFPFNGEGKLPELRAAIEWLHSFNETVPPAERIQFYGLDLPYGGGALRPALDYVWVCLDRVDPELARRSRASMEGALRRLGEGWPNGAKKRFEALDAGDRSALVHGISELEQAFDSQRSKYSRDLGLEEFDRFRQAVTVARQTLTFMQDPEDGSNPRDQALAANLQWVLEYAARNGKVIIWAHNAHVQKQSIEVVGAPMKPAASMGQILAGRLGDQYLAVGTTVDRLASDAPGSPAPAKPASVDNILANLVIGSRKVPCYFVDLRQAARTGPVAGWLNAPHEMRFQEMYLRITPGKAFDALFFVEHASPSKRIAEPSK
jgi:erythromycin esterase